MNLGQLIGQLIYGAELVEGPPVQTSAPATVAKPEQRRIRRALGGRPRAIAEVLGKHPEGLRVREIAALAGIENVSVVNAYLSQMADVEKSGKRRAYVYRLKSQQE